jgi:hypothetical protein
MTYFRPSASEPPKDRECYQYVEPLCPAGTIHRSEMSDFDYLWFVNAGADLCIALHRTLETSKGTKDCIRQALAAGIPTYLIEDNQGIPRRLQAGDKGLQLMAGLSLRTYPYAPTVEVEVMALPDFYNSGEKMWNYASFACP